MPVLTLTRFALLALTVGVGLMLGEPVASHARATGRTRAIQRAPRHVALFIGIGDYKVLTDVPNFAVNGGLTDLSGPENDIRRMQASLLQWGFTDTADVKVLTNSAATRDGIARSFRWLQQRASDSSDVVMVYYSGHGTHVPDENHEEADGEDEAIVPYDAVDFSQPAQVVIDDSLGVWLGALTTRNVTFIVDACFSGSITRGEPRGHAKGLQTSRALSVNDGPRDGLREGGVRGLGHTVISASRSFEVAQELPFPRSSTHYNGVLTYHLTRLFDGASATRGLRYDELMGALRQAVAGESVSQIPQIEGDSTSPLFRSRVGVASRAFSVVYAQRGNVVTLGVGAAHGVRTGAIYDIFGAAETRFSTGRVAQVLVTAVADTVSTATMIGESGDAPLEGMQLPTNARAVLALVPLGATDVPKLRLFVAPSAQASYARISGLDASRVEVVRDSTRAHATMTRDRGVLEVIADGTVLPPLESANQSTLRTVFRGESVLGYRDGAVCDALTRAFTIAKFAALNNPAAPEALQAFVRVVPTTARPPFDFSSTADSVRTGDQAIVYALVRVPDEAAAKTRLYVSVAATGFVSNAAILTDRPVDAPFPVNAWILVSKPLTISPPAGREIIKFTVSSNQYDLSSLISSAKLCDKSLPEPMRSARSGADAVAGWTTVSRIVHILPAKQP